MPQDQAQKFDSAGGNSASTPVSQSLQTHIASPAFKVFAVLIVVGIIGNVAGAIFKPSTQPNVSQNNKETTVTKAVTTVTPAETPSQKASRFRANMETTKFVEIMGYPDWVILQSDKGKFKLPDKSIYISWYWKNPGCAPVSVDLNRKIEVIGWDEGKFCAPDADILNPPMTYSCGQADRKKYCLNS